MLASTALLRDLANQAEPISNNELVMSRVLKQEIGELCDTLDSSGRTLDSLLNDVLDFLDVGGEHAEQRDLTMKGPQKASEPMESVLTEVIREAWEMEARTRGVSGGDMDDLEVYLEIMPRETGTWQLDRDKLPLQRSAPRSTRRLYTELNPISFGKPDRAVLKLLINAFQCTPRGYIAVICEDISRVSTVLKLPNGAENLTIGTNPLTENPCATRLSRGAANHYGIDHYRRQRDRDGTGLCRQSHLQAFRQSQCSCGSSCILKVGQVGSF